MHPWDRTDRFDHFHLRNRVRIRMSSIPPRRTGRSLPPSQSCSNPNEFHPAAPNRSIAPTFAVVFEPEWTRSDRTDRFDRPSFVVVFEPELALSDRTDRFDRFHVRSRVRIRMGSIRPHRPVRLLATVVVFEFKCAPHRRHGPVQPSYSVRQSVFSFTRTYADHSLGGSMREP
jgi:hypothetical protein